MLKGARTVLGWTQPELAERAGVSLHSVLRAETGTNSRRGTIEAIVRALEEGGIRFLRATNAEGEGFRFEPGIASTETSGPDRAPSDPDTPD